MGHSLPKCRTALRALLRSGRPPSWLDDRNIVAVGIGWKIIDSHKTETLSIRVYVRSKLRRSQVGRPVPRTITVGGLRIATDVIRVGNPKLHQYDARQRPAVPGCKIQCASSLGTVGALVRPIDGEQRLVLSAGHVAPQVGLAAYQPGSGTDNQIGVVAMIAPLTFNPSPTSFASQVDACVIRVADPAAVDGTVRAVNVRPTKLGNIVMGQTVTKVGWKSDVTKGAVEDPNAHWGVRMRDPLSPGTRARVGFADVVFASYAAEEGDSGSIVLTEGGLAVGLHIGVAGEYSVFCRLRRVFEVLRLRF